MRKILSEFIRAIKDHSYEVKTVVKISHGFVQEKPENVFASDRLL